VKYLVLLLFPLLLVDCFLNWVIGGSFRNTLSGEAWNQREHKHWGWTHRLIDALFFWQASHCQTQAVREARYGSVWKAWYMSLRSS
jgi:hypothetical protein